MAEPTGPSASSGPTAPGALVRHRKKIILGAVAILVLAILVPGGAYGYWAYRGTNDFCASCHIMDVAHASWADSVHKTVECKECHTQDLFGRMRLGWQFVIERKEEVGPHAKVDQTVCQRCHASDDARWAQVAGTRGHAVHNERARLQCLECHARNLHKFEPDVGRCRECHTERLVIEKMQVALAEETGGQECLACHKFAVKDGASLIPSRDECASCHKGVVGVETPPLLETGKPFHAECRDCHKVHERAFRVPVDCIACHTSVLATGGKHVADGRLEDCIECHEPHTWKID